MSQTEHATVVSASWAADRLGIPLRTFLYRVKRNGTPKPIAKLDGRTGAYLFNRSDIEALVNEVAA